MLENGFIQSSVIALLLGFIIGIQRELRHIGNSHDFGGSRTFAIISFIGFLSAFLSGYSPYFLLAAFLSTSLLLIAYNIASGVGEKQRGTTTEFSALSAFLLGSLLNFIDAKFVIFCAIVLLLILNLKDKIQELEKYIGKDDLNAAVLFLTMTFVVLPILPEHPVDALGLFNLYSIWLMVVLIAGISFAGYIAVRIYGSGKGIVLTGFLGGLVSSTAVTLSLSRKALGNEIASQKLAVGVMLASTVMLARAMLLIFLFNQNLASGVVIAFMATFVLSLSVAAFFYHKSKTANEGVASDIEYKNPFDIKEALVLGLFFGAIIALVKLSKEYVGDSGIYAVSFLSGITDVDAIIMSLSGVAGSELTFKVASVGIVIAVITNSVSKFLICYFVGTKGMAKAVGIYYLSTCALLAALTFF
jgi:uncharacterized membrane protein (DUF4010 family)